MLSKNSASSRAIPFATMLQKVQDEPFIPIAWQKEHKGMQGSDYFTVNDIIDVTPVSEELSGTTNATTDALPLIEKLWLHARDEAIRGARALSRVGVTKQLCNRLLEPFLYHTVICTGSEWSNFFALRAHPQAEIHIADLAQKMLDAYNESTPKQLKAGQWHVPFGDDLDPVRIAKVQRELGMIPKIVKSEGDVDYIDLSELKVKIATARCARVSYLNFEGKDDYNADLKLYETLSTSGHWSPFEHCAKAMSYGEWEAHLKEEPHASGLVNESVQNGWSGNFRGFIQLRKTFEGENKTDPRVINKIVH